MHNGNCVKNGPKTITITCNATVDTRQSSNGCTSSTWTDTTYRASDDLPFTVYIAQNLYEKGIKSRNGCDSTYHQGVTYVANHIINSGNRVSTWRGAKFNSSVSWDNEVGYDGKVSYGVSTISKSSDLSAGLVEITSPVTTITDTVNGQEYVINLVDCAGGGDPSPVYPKCGIASGQSYPSPGPIKQHLCSVGNPPVSGAIQNKRTGKWERTCATDDEFKFCSAYVLLDVVDPDPDPDPSEGRVCFGRRYVARCTETMVGSCREGEFVAVDYFPPCADENGNAYEALSSWNMGGVSYGLNKRRVGVSTLAKDINPDMLCDNHNPNGFVLSYDECYFQVATPWEDSVLQGDECSNFTNEETFTNGGIPRPAQSGWYKCTN